MCLERPSFFLSDRLENSCLCICYKCDGLTGELSGLTTLKVACRVSFQPSINRGLPYGTALMVDDWKPGPSVFRRLVDNASKVMEKKQKQEQLSHRPFDPRTGRELFKPLIGRKPYNVCYLSNLHFLPDRIYSWS